VPKTGVSAVNAPGLELMNISVKYGSEYGMKITNSPRVVIKNSTVIGGGWMGISVQGDGAQVLENRVQDFGLFARAQGSDSAINVDGRDALVFGNFIERSGNLGIRFSNKENVRIKDNMVINPCLRATDCGGIYTWTGAYPMPPAANKSQNAVVEENVVIGSRGSMEGAGGKGKDRAAGIYLDELSSGVTVRKNTIVDAELGIYLHNAQFNIIEENNIQGVVHASFSAHLTRTDGAILRGNKVIRNRLTGYRRYVESAGGLPIESNVYAFEWHHPTSPESFFNGVDGNVVMDNEIYTISGADVPKWMLISDVPSRYSYGDTANFAKNNTLINRVIYDSVNFKYAGENLIKNGLFEYDKSGWRSYAAQYSVGPYRECETGSCVRFSVQATSDMLSSQLFSMNAAEYNNKYYLEYVTTGGVGGGAIKAVVRRAAAPWDDFGLNQRMQWLAPDEKIKTAMFFRAKDSAPARIDFYGIPGRETFIDNVRLMHVTSIYVPDLSRFITYVINKSNKKIQLNCEDLNTKSCRAVNQKGVEIRWPLSIDSKQTEFIFVRNQ
jgi:parallel beta-helix repeat protein